MTTITLEIHPSFNSSCYFQLDRQSVFCNLIFQINSADKKRWEIKVDNTETINEIERLTKKIVLEAIQENRIILDGVRLKCTIIENGISKQHEFICPEYGTNELMLVNNFFETVQKYIFDQSFVNYIEHIEGYFVDNLPVKIFEEQPLRLRIYGSLSIHEKEALTATINKVIHTNEVVIDMTNFVGMGTILYECFCPLKNIPKLTFLANENAIRHIQAMGFNKNMVASVAKEY